MNRKYNLSKNTLKFICAGVLITEAGLAFQYSPIKEYPPKTDIRTLDFPSEETRIAEENWPFYMPSRK